MKYTDKTEISKSEYLQLVGLLTLASQHERAMEDIRTAALQITGETDDCGHTCDAIWNGYSADELLGKLGIKVTD